MKIVIFGLTISSSWGNGHATLWRGLCRALAERSHQLVFFERDLPYYASARDFDRLDYMRLVLYPSWQEVREQARRELLDADVAIVTSYCPDGAIASDTVLDSRCPVRAFYDLDTPVTLAKLERGERPEYLSARGLSEFDLVLSFTGGRALQLLRERLGARRAEALYGHVDPSQHRPVLAVDRYQSSLSYLGTYAADRQAAVERLFLEPARRAPSRRFVLGGAMYPDTGSWPRNVSLHQHVVPSEHPAFFCSSRLTLNVTRATMAKLGHCPSGRLFEAAACGVPIISDWFEGLDEFFDPESELFIALTTQRVLEILDVDQNELDRVARRARERVLDEHTAAARAITLERLLATAPAASAAASQPERTAVTLRG